MTHRAYQARLRESIVRLVAENPALGKDVEAYTDVIGLFYAMDLDRAAPILRANYGRGGPMAIDPVVMLRAILLMFYLQSQSFGALVQRLAGSALLRVLVGCDDPPGRTTFYDFLARLPGFRTMARRAAKRRVRKRRPKRSTRRGRRNRCAAPRRCSSWSTCATPS